MKIVNLKSSSTIKGHLDCLKAKGFITWEPGLPRTLKIIRQNKTANYNGFFIYIYQILIVQ
jgi:SOS-response transcriptional repressor LexA